MMMLHTVSLWAERRSFREIHLPLSGQDEYEQDDVSREIEWSPSRTGLINPVAIFDPVELEGTTVSRASVHNISIMEELELGIGDQIDGL